MKTKISKLRWRKGMPEVDGLYWHRNSSENNKHLTWVETLEGKRIVNFLDGAGSLNVPVEWAGPIRVPEPEV